MNLRLSLNKKDLFDFFDDLYSTPMELEKL